jgi:TRAP transporter TAXI family solute receptor
MENKRFVRLLGTICGMLSFVALFLIVPCAKPVPASEPRKPYAIQIYTYYVGTWAYIQGVALAEFINKDSNWLRATAVEAKSTETNVRLLIERPEMRKNTLVHTINGAIWQARHGIGVFKSPYDKIRTVGLIGTSFMGILARDPNINTLKDLSAKRVSVGLKPSIGGVDFPIAVLKHAGVKNVTYSYLGYTDGPRALKDGLVDACISSAFPGKEDRTKYIAVPSLIELLQVVPDVKFISIDQASFEAAKKEIGIPVYLFTIPPRALTPKQTNPWASYGYYVTWTADAEMPNDVVTEICRVYLKNVDRFREYAPPGEFITKETIGKLGPEENMHPAALKFYRENNIKTGFLNL